MTEKKKKGLIISLTNSNRFLRTLLKYFSKQDYVTDNALGGKK